MSNKNTLNIQAHTETQDGQDRDTIKVVIRDAKPPFFARFLQFLMRLVCFLLLLCVCAIGIPRLFGINQYNVLTGSMTPTYPVGTLVFVQPKDPSTIRPGEVVTVVMDEQLTLVTHRVVTNDYEAKTITTKGDANNSNDTPSRYENVVGVVCFSIPYVGEIVDYLTNDDTGRIMGVALLIGILALTFIAEGICSLLTKQKAHFANDKKGKKGKSAGAGSNAEQEQIVNVDSDVEPKQITDGSNETEPKQIADTNSIAEQAQPINDINDDEQIQPASSGDARDV